MALQSHPYRQNLSSGSNTLNNIQDAYDLSAPYNTNNSKNSSPQHSQHNNSARPLKNNGSSESSSANTFHSAQTVSRNDTNQSLSNNNVDSPSSRSILSSQPQQTKLLPQPSLHPDHAYLTPPVPLQLETSNNRLGARDSNESLRSYLRSQTAPSPGNISETFIHHSRGNSSPGNPGTPLGARSFSMPLQGGEISAVNSRSQSPESNTAEFQNAQRSHDRKSKSVDLSHLYLLDRNESTHFTLTNESLSDVSHNLIKQYLGENSSSSLLPRMKTIEMYRKNVKKSNDPKVLFQYAQYMLQTALTLDTSKSNETTPDLSKSKSDDPNLEKNMKKQFLKEAVHYLKKLADKGYTDAQYLLGDAYSSGALGKIENKESFNLFQSAAKHGHVESAYRTAYCYEEGLGVSRDSRRAIEFLKYAASKNHPSAMYKLGVYSFYGRMGLPDNVNVKKNGIQWLTRAVTKANELTNAAPYELAKIHEEGFLDIVIPDRKYAMELYVQAASLGHVKSSSILGKAYELGNEIISQDSDLSIHYYTQAALGGDAESMLSLCAWYLVGNPPNLPKDEYEAFQWALKAANSNFGKAQYAIGHFYEKGVGVEQNLALAKEWYVKAKANNDPRAGAKLAKLAGLNTVVNLSESTSRPELNDKKASKKKLKASDKKDKDCIIM